MERHKHRKQKVKGFQDRVEAGKVEKALHRRTEEKSQLTNEKILAASKNKNGEI